jgi:hypothetical protein
LRNDNAQNKQNISAVEKPQSPPHFKEQKLLDVANRGVLIGETNMAQKTLSLGELSKKEEKELSPVGESLFNATPLLFSESSKGRSEKEKQLEVEEKHKESCCVIL